MIYFETLKTLSRDTSRSFILYSWRYLQERYLFKKGLLRIVRKEIHVYKFKPILKDKLIKSPKYTKIKLCYDLFVKAHGHIGP